MPIQHQVIVYYLTINHEIINDKHIYKEKNLENVLSNQGLYCPRHIGSIIDRYVHRRCGSNLILYHFQTFLTSVIDILAISVRFAPRVSYGS